MADKILHKRSLTPGAVPTTQSLAVGELALNVPDGKAFIRKSGSAGDLIVPLVSVDSLTSGSIIVSGAVSASQFSGSGAGLFDISASAIVGLNLSMISSASVTASISPNQGFKVNTTSSFSGSAEISGTLTLLNGAEISGSTYLTGGITNQGNIVSTGNTTLSGSLNVTGAIVGTNNARLTGSVGISGSFNVYGDSIMSGTLEVTNAITGNLDGTASYSVSGSYAITSSYVSGSSGVLNDLVVTGTASISFLNTSIISSSISYSSGSNIIGNTLTNTQAMTGSVGITGSLTTDDATRVTLPNLTGSLFGTASAAITASYIKAEGVDGLNLTLISSGSATASISPVDGFTVNVPSSFSGSVKAIYGTFSGSGADLYDISASSVVGLNLALISSGTFTASISPSGGLAVNTKAAISGNLEITGGVLIMSQSNGINMFGTASHAVSASVAFTVVSPPGQTTFQTFTSSLSWSFQHNLGTFYPVITVYDQNRNIIIPETVTNTSLSSSLVLFTYPQAGTITATVGGGLPAISSSFANYVLRVDENGLSATWQPAATSSFSGSAPSYKEGFTGSTWVVNHNMDNLQVVTQCFNSNGSMFFPEDITISNANTVTVTVGLVKSGYVIVK